MCAFAANPERTYNSPNDCIRGGPNNDKCGNHTSQSVQPEPQETKSRWHVLEGNPMHRRVHGVASHVGSTIQALRDII
jgi:hypothetical protein